MASACRVAEDDIYSIPKNSPPLGCSQPFYPWDRLLNYFRDNDHKPLRQILECPCGQCSSDARLFDEMSRPLDYIDKIIGKPGTRPDWDRAAVSLLALLVRLGRPRFITPFLQHNFNDSQLEVLTESEAAETIAETYWPHYLEESHQRAINLAHRFVEEIPRFAIPRLDSSQYVFWSENRVLPFLNETEIGSRSESGHILPEGASSRVFKFEIHDEYRNFKEHPNVRKFARKEIHASCDLPPLLAISEKKALDRVGALSHPHIVKLLKTYKLGQNYNMIFPCAQTNLDKYLRDSRYKAYEKRQGPIEASPLWEQVLGITGALSAIHSYGIKAEERKASGDEKLIGFHFDIKDANILIEDDDKWVISDFGQATFKSVRKNGTTSQVLNQGGTDSYAPPEFQDDFSKLGRRFDIWSLGCVFLEVLAFIVRGYDGLNQKDGDDGDPGLDEARKTSGQGRLREDHRFYTEGNSHGSWKVKPEIEDFMSNLRGHVNPPRSQSSNFLDRVIDLIKRMLSPVPSKRPKAEDVFRILKSHLSEAATHTSQVSDLRAFSPPATQIEIRKEAFALMSESGLHRRYGESDERVYFHVLRSSKEQSDSQGNVWIVHTAATGPERISLPPDSALVPNFVFPKNPNYNGPSLSFIQCSRSRNNEPSPLLETIPSLEYFFSGREPFKDASTMQSIMTGQQLCGHFTIKEIILKELAPSLARKIGTSLCLLPSSVEPRLSQSISLTYGTQANVQLWTEHEGRDGAFLRADNPLPKARRTRARHVHREVPPCRVVIYCKRSIILLRIAQNEKINKAPSERQFHGGDPCMIEFVPTDKWKDESFSALIISPPNLDDENSYAAIPLNRDWLQELEEARGWTEFNSITQEYTSVKLVFESPSALLDKEAFHTEYDKVKDAWRERRKAVSS
ncbi:MAG: hypothetical protein M1820_003484 [Bogoriella megaspora]|nr:MAG: hypothetical protein M1820_003484 [Bogoriella megaspora]